MYIFSCCSYFRIFSYFRGCGFLIFNIFYNKYYFVWFLDLVKILSCMDGRNCRSYLVFVFRVVFFLYLCRVIYLVFVRLFLVIRVLLIFEKIYFIFGLWGILERFSFGLSWNVFFCGIFLLILVMYFRITGNMFFLFGGFLVVCKLWSCGLFINFCRINIFWFCNEFLYGLVLSFIIILEFYRKALKFWCLDVRLIKLIVVFRNC